MNKEKEKKNVGDKLGGYSLGISVNKSHAKCYLETGTKTYPANSRLNLPNSFYEKVKGIKRL